MTNQTTSQKYRIYLVATNYGNVGDDTSQKDEKCKEKLDILEEDEIEDAAEEYVDDQFNEWIGEYPPSKNWVAFQPVDENNQDLKDAKPIVVKVRVSIDISYDAEIIEE